MTKHVQQNQYSINTIVLEKVFENIKKKLQFTPTTVSMIRDFMLSW
jgi:hypothetical protein